MLIATLASSPTLTAPQAAARRKSSEEPRESYGGPAGAEDDKLKWFTRGNKVTPLYDDRVTPDNHEDEIFRQVKLGIQAARSTIQLEMFGFGQTDIVDALLDAHNRGVKVQVVLDPVNDDLDWEQEKQECAQRLIDGGVDVKWYPVKEGNPDEKTYDQINHVKMLILDGDKAIIGGMNWGSHSPMNHDVDVLVEGPIVDRMEALFGKDYLKSGGRKADLIPIEKTPEAGDTPVSLLTTSDEPKDRSVKAALYRAIRDARKSIEVEMFVLSDRGIVRSLCEARKRGVNVKVLLNPFEIEGKKLNEIAADQLERAGVQVKWFPFEEETGRKLHAKLGIFDGEEVILGSANWSNAGLSYNREANVDVIDKGVAGDFQKMFRDDWKQGLAEPVYPPNEKQSKVKGRVA
ncbi:MAG: phosphatidylserine/phosphatidylglycerophosphate/cardiolipin synthase family protein [Candidatus Eremiobacterota bacterium]